MGRSHHQDQKISRWAGGIVALFVSVSLFMYMLYDPGTVSRGSGPVMIAGIGAAPGR